MILYRPVGTAELKLIKENDYRSFPPRLPEQPIFYPVLNREYVREIAENGTRKLLTAKVTLQNLKLTTNILKTLKYILSAENIIRSFGFLPENWKTSTVTLSAE